jgi:hypothetical protein
MLHWTLGFLLEIHDGQYRFHIFVISFSRFASFAHECFQTIAPRHGLKHPTKYSSANDTIKVCEHCEKSSHAACNTIFRVSDAHGQVNL